MTPRDRPDPVRVRPVRAVWFAVSMSVTLLAFVTALGLLPVPSVAAASESDPSEASTEASSDTGWSPDQTLTDVAERMALLTAPAPTPRPVPSPPSQPGDTQPTPPRAAPELALPAGSGAGHRVVLDLSAQRVWLVRSGGSVRSTYLVSGSVYDNLQPGQYRVYSRSEWATSYDYTSTMRWMVRFTEGDTAAIGFHSIPRDSSGDAVQTWRQLGTPQSHGCIRQRPADAERLWHFAPIGTPVVVVA